MLNYYKVLGLSQNASTAEIKRAYRRLAVVYHPDKNRDPRAEEVFKEINEAYEVLSDPDKKRGYDYLVQNPGVLQPERAVPRHRDPAYRQTRPRTSVKSEKQRLRELMSRFIPVTEKISMLCFVVSMMFVIDFCWPAKISSETVEKVGSGTSTGDGKIVWDVRTNSGNTFNLVGNHPNFYSVGDDLRVERSAFFLIPLHVISHGHSQKIGMSIYGNFIFAPVVLLVVSALGVWMRKDTEFGFNLGVSSFIVLLILIFMMIIV